MKNVVLEHLTEARSALEAAMADEAFLEAVEAGARMLAECLKGGGRVISCGNGGSMCDAMHFAEELSGRYRDDRPSYGAVSISDPSHLTCVGNDYGFEHVFSRYVEGVGRPGDVLVGLSTSGSSRNVVLAAEAARAKGMKILVLTGRRESELGGLADVEVVVEAGKYADRVQEIHIKVVHILIDLVERLMEEK